MTIYAKIKTVMEKVHGVEKSERNNHAGYEYAGHEAVTAALRDHFVEVGIVRQASVTSCEVLQSGSVQLMVHVSYVDVDDPQSRVEIDMPAIQPPQGKPSAQQVGQALSYAIKNVEFKLFALTGDPEPDTDAGTIDHGYDDRTAPNKSTNEIMNERRANGPEISAKADAIEDVLVIYNEDEQEGAATGKEGAKLLAERMKKATYFESQTMLGHNADWIAKLPVPLQRRLEEISDGRKQERKAA